MPKVDSIKLNFRELKESGLKKKSGSSARNRFDEIFKKDDVEKVVEVKEISDDEIMYMFYDIDKLAKKMIKNFNQANMKNYVEAVRNFMSFILDNAYDVKEKTFKKNMGTIEVKRSIVNVLDKELNNLAKAFLSREVDHIKALDKVGKIKGLLVDLTK